MDAIACDEYFGVPPQRVWDAWLDEDEHGEMTGAGAESDSVPGGAFSAWDGYITGTWRLLAPGQRILMSWRTTNFSEKDPDSIVDLEFRAEGEGTRLILTHANLPVGTGDEYRQGWIDYYFEPMKDYFASRHNNSLR